MWVLERFGAGREVTQDSIEDPVDLKPLDTGIESIGHIDAAVSGQVGYIITGVFEITSFLIFMGADITMTRFLVSLPLPIIAGLIAQRIPLPLKFESSEESQRP